MPRMTLAQAEAAVTELGQRQAELPPGGNHGGIAEEAFRLEQRLGAENGEQMEELRQQVRCIGGSAALSALWQGIVLAGNEPHREQRANTTARLRFWAERCRHFGVRSQFMAGAEETARGKGYDITQKRAPTPAQPPRQRVLAGDRGGPR